MSCDLIIAVHNQLEFTRGCIESIKANTRIDHRVIVVDDASDRDTSVYLEGLSGSKEILLLRNQTNLGWVKSINRGLESSNAQYACVMNNDVLVYPGWLEEMVAIAEKEKFIGIVNPLWELPKHFRGTREDYFKTAVLNQKGRFIETDWARGFCFLVKRPVLDKVAGFDEDYSPGYYDDWDYSLRAMKQGFIVVRALGAFVWHFKNVTYEQVLGKAGINHELNKKKEVFLSHWGKFDKVLLVLDSSVKDRIGGLAGKILGLLRRQARVVVIKGKIIFPLEHTNCFVREVPGFSLKLAVLIHLFRNSLGSKGKRYDYVVCPENVERFLTKFRLIREKFILKKIPDLLKEEK
jgi:GT2 family glycosyltransferase